MCTCHMRGNAHWRYQMSNMQSYLRNIIDDNSLSMSEKHTSMLLVNFRAWEEKFEYSLVDVHTVFIPFKNIIRYVCEVNKGWILTSENGGCSEDSDVPILDRDCSINRKFDNGTDARQNIQNQRAFAELSVVSKTCLA